ncbi:MAG: hypothetical protein OEZ01_06005 [Candidatus Heimdallarchaeota archaeon]|nr:hypothetical protein [Candidatus Heimdallarchaeota archaeon]MDH5645540.1 hypothetical protein [Candidatus Heimdallarchaeota archaeon]
MKSINILEIDLYFNSRNKDKKTIENIAILRRVIYIMTTEKREILFPEFKLFLLTSLFFLDLGILFGALNSFRMAGLFDLPQIHQTHWTSTLFGGVTLLLLSLIYYTFSHLNEEVNQYHKLTLIVYGLFIVGILSSFMAVWINHNFIIITDLVMPLAASLYGVLLALFMKENKFRENLKSHPAALMMIISIVWLLVAFLMSFNIASSSLDRIFLYTYVYGFFSTAFFGLLSYVLPEYFNQKPRNMGSIRRDIFLFNISAIFIILSNKYSKLHFSISVLGPVIWGISGLIFTMYVFDLIYKVGVKSSLVGLIGGLVGFLFFVFDTFMKAILPVWVHQSHFHFIFLGTIIIVLVSLGTDIYLRGDKEGEKVKENKFDPKYIGIVMVILGVSGVLLGFTINNLIFAGYFGLFLFLGILILEFTIIMRKNK